MQEEKLNLQPLNNHDYCFNYKTKKHIIVHKNSLNENKKIIIIV